MYRTSETRRVHELSAPLRQEATSGRLVVKPGAAHLSARGDHTQADLYRGSFEAPAPIVRVKSGTVTIQYPRLTWLTDPGSLFRRPGSGQVTLNGSIPWHIRISGGTAHSVFELSDLALYAFELGGGVSHVEIVLPYPAGTVPIRIAGGVHDVTIVRPAPVPVQVKIGRGARRLTLDDQHFGAIGGITRWHSPGYDDVPDRFDIAISGGADTLTVRTG